MDTPIDARAAGAARATRRARRRDEHAPHDGQGLDGGLAGELDQVDGLDAERLVELLELLDLEGERIALLRRAVTSRLRTLVAAARRTAPLLKVQEAAKLLAVSRDWLHDHAEEEGLAVHLGGNVVRYDPVAVERLRTRRRRSEPPRD